MDPEFGTRLTVIIPLGVLLAAMLCWSWWALPVIMRLLGGPALYVSGGRLVYLFPWHKSVALDHIAGIESITQNEHAPEITIVKLRKRDGGIFAVDDRFFESESGLKIIKTAGL